MEKKEKFTEREHNKQGFDKRLIKEIVSLLEAGLPRREAVARYGMTIGTLSDWMRTYGSEAYQTSKRRIYKPSERRSVVRAVESGMTPREAQISFGLPNVALVRKWVRDDKQKNTDLSPATPTITSMSKQPRTTQSNKVKALQDEVKSLKEELEYAQLKAKALDTMIDIAEEQLKIQIRKKSGARQS